jgi:hypothetical protein
MEPPATLTLGFEATSKPKRPKGAATIRNDQVSARQTYVEHSFLVFVQVGGSYCLHPRW